MKRNIIKILIVSVMVISCDDRLDIEPKQELVSEDVLINESNLRAALTGAYSSMKGTLGTNEGGELYGGDFNVISELLSDDDKLLFFGSFAAYEELFDKNLNITTTNTAVRDNWVRAYATINIANNVLANLNLVTENESRNNIEGQARCIRAMMYFELVRFWCKSINDDPNSAGVPLVLFPTLTAQDAERLSALGRATVEAVYSFVVPELLRAKQLLPIGDKNGVFLSKYAAGAILSRVYLQMGTYNLAALEADSVIQSGLYTLVGKSIDAYNNTSNTSEDIFAIQQSPLSNAGTNNSGLATFYADFNGLGRADIDVGGFLGFFEDGDERGQFQEDITPNQSVKDVTGMLYEGTEFGGIATSKWISADRNIPVIRLAEMYLSRAEGNFEAGTVVGDTPLNDINLIRGRAGLPDRVSVNRDSIRDERMKELALEGFRLHDLKRWELSIGDLPFDADELVLPIPQREREVYDIPQNDGY